MPKKKENMRNRKWHEKVVASELRQLATWRTERHKPGDLRRPSSARAVPKLAHATKRVAESWAAGRLGESADTLRGRLRDAAQEAGISRTTADDVIHRTWEKTAGEAERRHTEALKPASIEDVVAEYLP